MSSFSPESVYILTQPNPYLPLFILFIQLCLYSDIVCRTLLLYFLFLEKSLKWKKNIKRILLKLRINRFICNSFLLFFSLALPTWTIFGLSPCIFGAGVFVLINYVWCSVVCYWHSVWLIAMVKRSCEHEKYE